MTASGLDLRDLVASVVREMVGDLVQEAVRDSLPSTPPTSGPTAVAPGSRAASAGGANQRSEAVRIEDDADLDRFARQLLTLFENPKNRQDLRAGRLTFRLARNPTPDSNTSGAATRVDRGAVTERQVKAAAEAGHRLILGRGAVLTPLGREKARALHVHIEKER